jgi:phosphonate degradation associated HDIG domain protein
MSTHAADLIACFRDRGHIAYDGEGVSQLVHGWQSGRLARLAGATVELQLAAWLHDVGHLLTELDGSPTLRGIDDTHEALGARALAPLFGDAVAQPVALHVAAKRYLAATRPGYVDSLSADSVRSLALQGGPMSDAECAAFSASAQARDAMRVRAWDDQAKDPAWLPGSEAAALGELAGLIEAVVGRR